MFEAIWNTLNAWERFEAIVLIAVIVVGVVAMLTLKNAVKEEQGK